MDRIARGVSLSPPGSRVVRNERDPFYFMKQKGTARNEDLTSILGVTTMDPLAQ